MWGKGKKKDKKENEETRRTSVTTEINNGPFRLTSTTSTTTYERTTSLLETRSVLVQGETSLSPRLSNAFSPRLSNTGHLPPLTDGFSFNSNTKPTKTYEPVYNRTKELSSKFPLKPITPASSNFPTTKLNNSYPASKIASSNPAIPSYDAQSPTSKHFPAKPRPQSAVVTSYNVPTYDTSGPKRGKVLIINNIAFKGKNERKGAENDSIRLTKLFTKLKFNVTAKKDLKKSGMESELIKFASDSSIKNYNMIVCVIMSHGTNMKDSNGTITQISGIDDNLLWVNNILEIFADAKYKHLYDKPKIFIFQCCRGDDVLVHTDATPFRPTRSYSDMLIAYSTLPGYVSHRDPIEGSWYIQKLCEVIEKSGSSLDIEEILKIVDFEISKLSKTNTQTACYESRGFKKCFLYQD